MSVAAVARLALLAALAGTPLATTLQPAPATAQPVLSGQNVPAQGGLVRRTHVDGLENPWAVAWLPDGTMLVTERPGRLRIVRDGALVETPVAGVPDVAAIGQGGLLDVAVDPGFAGNRTIYLTYSVGDAAANRTRIGAFTFDGTSLANPRILAEVAEAKSGGQHFGSRIAFAADGALLVSIGDGGNPPVSIGGVLARDHAQFPTSYLGKVLRIHDGAVTIHSSGHRNIQGLAVDPVTGVVWATEHGALGGDELNRIEPGANYGWPLVSNTREYGTGAQVGQEASGQGAGPEARRFREPALLWTNATAPSGLAIYRGSALQGWDGNLLAGGLMSQDVRRLMLDAEGRVTGETAIRIGQRVRDVRVGPDGLIYVVTDERRGRIFQFAPAPAPAPAPARPN